MDHGQTNNERDGDGGSLDEKNDIDIATLRSIHKEACHPIFWRAQRKQRRSQDYVHWLTTHAQT